MKAKKGFTLIELLVVVTIIGLLVAILLPTLGMAMELVRRAQCGSNLGSITKTMLVYAADNNSRFPALARPSDGSAEVVATNDLYNGTNRFFNLTDPGVDDPFAEGKDVSKPVSACLWLLVRQGLAAVNPEMFLCPSVPLKRSIDYPNYLREGGVAREAKYFSDFYTDTTKGGTNGMPMIAYSFHNPWSTRWRHAGDSMFVLGGDENNGADPTTEGSLNHAGAGHNVVRMDASAAFCKKQNDDPEACLHVGQNADNVYTRYDGGNPQTAGGVKNVNPNADVDYDTVLVPLEHDALTGWTTTLGS